MTQFRLKLRVHLSLKLCCSYFKGNGSKLVFKGFMTLYLEGTDVEEDEENQILPDINKNRILALVITVPNQHFTEPPQDTQRHHW